MSKAKGIFVKDCLNEDLIPSPSCQLLQQPLLDDLISVTDFDDADHFFKHLTAHDHQRVLIGIVQDRHDFQHSGA